MNSAHTARNTNTRTTGGDAQQLTLLPDLAPAANVSTRFLLSHDTRELGMRHVAEIRQMLADRKAARDLVSIASKPSHTPHAA